VNLGLGGGDTPIEVALLSLRGTWKWCHNWEGNGRGKAGESRERGEVR
jgi:hypothetical protein